MPYSSRRARVAAALGANAIAIVPTAPVQQRNRDCDFPYRHDSYFYYLSGFTEPQAWLVLRTDANGKLHTSLLPTQRSGARNLGRLPPGARSCPCCAGRRCRLFNR